MRFHSITYRRFGPFDDLTLDVSQGNCGLHLIYGLNEAGKTTALRGLGYFLFGFPHGKCDDFRYKSTEQRIGAKLSDRRGRQLECLRRRTKLNSLRSPDDRSPVPEEQLREFLAGLNKDQFAMLFGLNHDQLVEGGNKIVEGHGGLGEALFAAGAGLAGLRRIDQQLARQLEQLYKPRGQNKEISIHFRAIQETRDQLRFRTLQVEAWLGQEEKQRQAIARKTMLEAERSRSRKELLRLEAFRSALPAIGALQDLQAQLHPLTAFPLLDENFATEHRNTLTDLHAAGSKLELARKEVQRLEDELQTKEPQEAILTEAQAIERLKGELTVCRKAEHDRLGLYARMREHQGNARTILRNYFGRENLDEAESLRLNPAAQERIRALGGERKALLQAWEDVKERLAQLGTEITEMDQQLAAGSVPHDTTNLDALVRSIVQEGPLEKYERELADRFPAYQQKAELVLESLSECWKGTLDQAASLPVPTLERIHRYKQWFEQNEKTQSELEIRRQQCETTIRERTRQVERIILKGHVPSEFELKEARADRDTGVEVVRDNWVGKEADPVVTETFINHYAPGASLMDALKGSIHHCDDLSDQMRREVGRVAEVSIHQSEQRGAEEERGALVKCIQEQAQQFSAMDREWREEWKTSGINPKTPGEMHSWLQELGRLREYIGELRITAEQSQRLQQRIDGYKAKLCQALEIPGNPGRYSLSQLLESGRKEIETATEQKRRQEQLENQLRSWRLNRQREEQKEEQARQRLLEWEVNWTQAVRVIGLTANDEPGTVYHYLDQLSEMFRELREAGTIELRLQGIDRDREQFLVSVNGLRGRLDGSEHSPSTVETMQADLDNLVRRLTQAREVQTQRDLLESDLVRARNVLAQADKHVIELVSKLKTLREEAGVDREEDIPTAIQQSAERRRLETRIEEERSKLHQQARGQTLEAFLADALAAREGLEARLAELQNHAEPLDQEINQEAVVAGEARRQLEQWDQAGSEAADCRQEIESLVVGLREKVSEYAVLHLARQVLVQAIERYRQRHQSSMLNRAEGFFRLLTDGAFYGLEADENDNGQPVLTAIRSKPAERVEVAGLSDGTRDQLFLALRLAGIEQHLEDREPMPLVVDDILINFDENRARATLACLTELARRTQVLLFTHHAYLVKLAKDSVPDDMLFCHNLNDCS